MNQYVSLVMNVLRNGIPSKDRTGVGTISVFGTQHRYKMADGFPLLTMKKMDIKSVTSELMWFLEGSTDERRLAELRFSKPREDLVGKRTIWTDNADNQGVNLGYENSDHVKELGPIYGSQWREWYGVDAFYDQFKNLVDGLINNPNSRRHIVSAWNVNDIDDMALPPCHTMFQCYVREGKLSLQLYQRSADIGLGVPYNIASYALLLHILARLTNLEAHEFVHTIGDAHIYDNHRLALYRNICVSFSDLPRIEIDQEFIDKTKDVIYSNGKYDLNDVNLVRVLDYHPNPPLKLEMAV